MISSNLGVGWDILGGKVAIATGEQWSYFPALINPKEKGKKGKRKEGKSPRNESQKPPGKTR